MRGVAQRKAGIGREPAREANGSGPASSTLTIGRADDRAEAEADRFAGDMLADLHAHPTTIHRATATEDRLGGTTVDADTDRAIRSAGGGTALPQHLRESAETHTGTDLGGVRVHTGGEADRLSRSLDATAFTVGNDIFFSKGAYRPGTSDGDHLIAHEIGHTIQQGAGARRSIRRFLGLGKKKDPAKDPANQPDLRGMRGPDGQAAMTKQALEKALKPLEKSLQSLMKKKVRGEKEWGAAFLLRDTAQDLMRKMPDPNDKSSKVLGRVYPEEIRRIQYVIDEAGLIYDEYRVEMTKKKAAKIYEQAGRDSGDATKDGFKHLTGFAKATAFDDVGTQNNAPIGEGESMREMAERIQSQAELLGISKGEAAAISTFTAQDYKYINPATANSESWMRKQRGDEAVDKDKKTLFEEGSLHTGMAMQAMSKMPVWKGTTYRGETITKQDFENRFETTKGGGLRVKNPKLTRGTLSSTTKDLKIAKDFVFFGAKLEPGGYRVIYTNTITNGRDIEPLSVNPHEKEIATMPGAEFEVVSARNDGKIIWVKVKQTK